ncbi:mite allergen Der p 3-like [Choristoneura fumiferana]|uniref:mite allergen Der p 3-like n=1 Tax=Choristoneura fumiferana TaxID=7141 RepID=UPI003D15ADA8
MAVENVVIITISLIAGVVNSVASHDLEGFVVGGKRAKIEDFPHSVFLYIECFIGYTTTYACGASILNQAIVLTAAHCLVQCQEDSTFLAAYVGDFVAGGGSSYSADNYKLHENFDEKEISSDIALVRLEKNIKFGKNVRRVSLMRNPPYKKYAKVAGWGYTDPETKDQSAVLMQASQRVRTRPKCVIMLDRITPEGTICGGSKNAKSYVTKGDSGSALMALKYIQIGIVSYKDLTRSKSVCIYTDVAYFYDWVKTNSRSMYCEL